MGAAGPSAQAHFGARGHSLLHLRTETAAGGRGLRRARALGGLWDRGGRSRASEALKRTAELGDPAAVEKRAPEELGLGFHRSLLSSAACLDCEGRLPLPPSAFPRRVVPGRETGRLPPRGPARASRPR